MTTTITLNPRAESLNEALGITDERHEQIVSAPRYPQNQADKEPEPVQREA